LHIFPFFLPEASKISELQESWENQEEEFNELEDIFDLNETDERSGDIRPCVKHRSKVIDF